MPPPKTAPIPEAEMLQHFYCLYNNPMSSVYKIEQAITHFDLDVTSMQLVAESYSSIVRILTLSGGERLVLKIPFVQRKLRRELYALEHLRESMPVPQVVDTWQPEDGEPGAMLLSFIPGEIVSDRLSPDIAYQMGVLLGRLHTHKLHQYGEVFENTTADNDDWWGMLERRFHSWVPLCAKVLIPRLLQSSLDAFDKLSVNLPAPDGPCYTHFDYRPGNVLVQNGRITGLIDFESSQGGSADLDFIKIKNEVWDAMPECRRPFLQGYRSIRKLPDIERTLPFYSLGDAFGGIAWCVKRDKLDDPFFDVNLKRLRKFVNEFKT